MNCLPLPVRYLHVCTYYTGHSKAFVCPVILYNLSELTTPHNEYSMTQMNQFQYEAHTLSGEIGSRPFSLSLLAFLPVTLSVGVICRLTDDPSFLQFNGLPWLHSILISHILLICLQSNYIFHFRVAFHLGKFH